MYATYSPPLREGHTEFCARVKVADLVVTVRGTVADDRNRAGKHYAVFMTSPGWNDLSAEERAAVNRQIAATLDEICPEG